MNMTPEQEKIKKWANEYIEQENTRNIKIKEMMSNDEYIKWIMNFSIKNKKFSNHDWQYFPEKISKEDLEQVNNLSLFYTGIDRYASDNLIYPTSCDFGNFYKIKFENAGFKIGMLVGQGTLFFCDRIELENEKEFIDFNDIMNNKTRDNIFTIKNQLNTLSNSVISLYNSGVPLEAIVTTLDNTLNGLSKPKVYKKNHNN